MRSPEQERKESIQETNEFFEKTNREVDTLLKKNEIFVTAYQLLQKTFLPIYKESMALTPIQRSRILKIIKGLQELLEEDEPHKIFAPASDKPGDTVVDCTKDWAAIEACMERLELTWESKRVTDYLEAVAKRTGKPNDRRYWSVDSIQAFRKKLEEAI